MHLCHCIVQLVCVFAALCIRSSSLLSWWWYIIKSCPPEAPVDAGVFKKIFLTLTCPAAVTSTQHAAHKQHGKQLYSCLPSSTSLPPCRPRFVGCLADSSWSPGCGGGRIGWGSATLNHFSKKLMAHCVKCKHEEKIMILKYLFLG